MSSGHPHNPRERVMRVIVLRDEGNRRVIMNL
jgi:hypothetical protein